MADGKGGWVFPRKPLGTGAKSRTKNMQAGRTKFVPLKNTAGDLHKNHAGDQAGAQPNLPPGLIIGKTQTQSLAVSFID